MAALVAKFVGKKILGETVKNKFGKEDPYFESVPATRLDGKPSTSGRVKRRPKALPPGISEHDAQILTKVKRRAYRLDTCLFTFLGVKFGWGSVIGFIPVIGDALDALLALLVMRTCLQIEGGLPAGLKMQMLVNIVFDFFIGIVPFLGDLADAMFRANTKNAIILEKHLREKGTKHLNETGQSIPAVDPSSVVEFDRFENTSTPERRSQPPSRQPSHRSSRRPSPSDAQRQRPDAPMSSHPPAAKTTEGGGWFGRNKKRTRDVEMGEVAPPPRTQSRRKERQARRS